MIATTPRHASSPSPQQAPPHAPMSHASNAPMTHSRAASPLRGLPTAAARVAIPALLCLFVAASIHAADVPEAPVTPTEPTAESTTAASLLAQAAPAEPAPASPAPAAPADAEGYAQGWCLVGATLFNPQGPSGPQTLCVREGRISAILPPDAPLPPDMASVDAEGRILTPGLIEVQSRLGLTEVGAVGETNDHGAPDDVIAAAFRVGEAIQPRSSLVGVTRSGGVTSALALPSGGLIAGQAAFWDLGAMDDAELVVSDRALLFGSFTGSQLRGTSRGSLLMRLRETLDDARALRDAPERHEERRMRDLSAHRLHLQALAPLLEGTQRLALEVHAAHDMRALLRLADEEEIALLFYGASEAWVLRDELARRGIPVVVDPSANLPGAFDRLGARADNAALLHDAGVPVVLTSGSTHNARNLRYAAGNAVRAGLPMEAALAAITLRAAELAGADEDYGSLEVGKVANLVLWTGDPFEFASHAEHVIVRGQWMSPSHRQQRLLERYRTVVYD